MSILIDTVASQTAKPAPYPSHLGTKILGIRLPEATVREIKTEAKRRGKPVSRLILELWRTRKREPGES